MYQLGRETRLKYKTCCTSKPASSKYRPKLGVRVSAIVAQDHVQLSVNLLPARHQNDGAAARRERAMDVSESAKIVFDMFQDVQANHGVYRVGQRLEIGRLRKIAGPRFHVQEVPEPGSQAG